MLLAPPVAGAPPVGLAPPVAGVPPVRLPPVPTTPPVEVEPPVGLAPPVAGAPPGLLPPVETLPPELAPPVSLPPVARLCPPLPGAPPTRFAVAPPKVLWAPPEPSLPPVVLPPPFDVVLPPSPDAPPAATPPELVGPDVVSVPLHASGAITLRHISKAPRLSAVTSSSCVDIDCRRCITYSSDGARQVPSPNRNLTGISARGAKSRGTRLRRGHPIVLDVIDHARACLNDRKCFVVTARKRGSRRPAFRAAVTPNQNEFATRQGDSEFMKIRDPRSQAAGGSGGAPRYSSWFRSISRWNRNRSGTALPYDFGHPHFEPTPSSSSIFAPALRAKCPARARHECACVQWNR